VSDDWEPTPELVEAAARRWVLDAIAAAEESQGAPPAVRKPLCDRAAALATDAERALGLLEEVVDEREAG
jgi:hypothetical protein